MLIEKIKEWNQKYGEFPNTIDYKFFENNGIKFKYMYHSIRTKQSIKEHDDYISLS